MSNIHAFLSFSVLMNEMRRWKEAEKKEKLKIEDVEGDIYGISAPFRSWLFNSHN